MTGTLINTAAILVGGIIGLRLGGLLKEKTQQTIITALGLFTIGIGITLFLETENALIVLGGLLLGGLLGEGLQIEEGIHQLGERLKARFSGQDEGDFTAGFLVSSVLFCTGPMAVLGAIQDGLLGDYRLLAIKSVMDGFAAFAISSSLGMGVVFSAGTVFIYQGFFSLLAQQLQDFMTPEMIAEMSATGGLLLIGLAISSLLELKPIRVGNFLPALAISPLLVWLLARLPF